MMGPTASESRNIIFLKAVMYNFKIETDKKAYDEYIESHGGWYIQSSRWERVKEAWKCTFVSGFQGDEMVLAALVMEREFPAAGKILYCPNGPVCDYENKGLLSEFTAFAKKLLCERKATCFIIDPPVSLRIDGETQESGVKLHKALLSLGYEFNGNIANYTYKQPVQLFIPLRDENGNTVPADKLLKKCEKGVRYSVRLGQNRGIFARTFHIDDIDADSGIMDDFVNVMKDTSTRDSFVERDGSYCAKLLEEFDGASDLKIVYYDLELDKELQEKRQHRKVQCLAQLDGAHEKKARQLNEEISSIDKQTEHFESRMKEVSDFIASGGQTAKAKLGSDHTLIPLAGGLSIYYAGIGSCLFGGTKDVIRNETRSSHYLNYLRLCESVERDCYLHDLGYIKVKEPGLNPDGTLGKMEAQPNFEGIFSFKKSFGSNYHEFIGEYILVGNRLKYYAYSQLMPKAKDAKIALLKKLRGR